jgi:PEP-CTERM motif
MTHRFALSIILGASILVFAAPSVAQAGALFTNFGPALSYDISSGNPVGNAFDGKDYAQANSFLPSFSGSLQSLRIALSCAFGCPDAVGVSLTADNADQPGLVLESFVVAGGALGPIGINNPPLFLLSVLHPSLNVGTRYWVAVGAGLTDTVAWNLNTTGDVSDQAISSDNGATWFSPSGNTPGALEVDAVPEPGSYGLVGGGVLLSLLLQRRRSRQSATPR